MGDTLLYLHICFVGKCVLPKLKRNMFLQPHHYYQIDQVCLMRLFIIHFIRGSLFNKICHSLLIPVNIHIETIRQDKILVNAILIGSYICYIASKCLPLQIFTLARIARGESRTAATSKIEHFVIIVHLGCYSSPRSSSCSAQEKSCGCVQQNRCS